MEENYNVDSSLAFEANFTLNDRFDIIMGDERFYRFFGDKVLYKFNALIYDGDLESYEKFFSSEDRKSVILRCMSADGSYRWIIIHKKAFEKDKTKTSEIRYSFVLRDICSMSQKFSKYFFNTKKYRSIMNLMDEKMFEYDYKTGIITIFCYINNRSEIIEKDDINEWKNRMIRLGFVEESQISTFGNLCDSIIIGVESFSFTFQSSIMSKGERNDILSFKGQTVNSGNERLVTVGIISEKGSRMKQGIMMDNYEVNLDPATGILNKKAITDQTKALINKANDDNVTDKMYLMIWDIDDFKNVNDTFGHYFGDEVIKAVADALNVTIGSRGLVGRIGGDEFFVFLQEVQDEAELRRIIKSITVGLKMRFDNGYQFSTSIGISCYNDDGHDFETLFKIADGSLYIAKDKGKDRYIIYDKEKHGNLLNIDRSRRNVTGVDFMHQIDKMDMVSDYVIQLMRGGKKAAAEIVADFMDKMNIHGASMFTGEDMKCVFSKGYHKNKPVSASYIFKDGYVDSFDEHNIKIINNAKSISIDYPEVYKYLFNGNICSALQFLYKKDGKVVALYEVDIFGDRKRKWSQDDISTIYIFVKAVSQML